MAVWLTTNCSRVRNVSLLFGVFLLHLAQTSSVGFFILLLFQSVCTDNVRATDNFIDALTGR